MTLAADGGFLGSARRHLCGATACAAVLGCDARVNSFSASSGNICAGDQVTLAWSVTGSASVAVTPSSSGLPNGDVPSTGQATITPTATTRVELHVSRFLGNPTTSIQEIQVHQVDDAPKPLTVSLADADAGPGCADGKVWATDHAKRFALNLRVATVTVHPGDSRTYELAHAGVHATIGPGVIATQFAGQPVTGDWTLTTPLGAGEACGTPALPHSLVADVFLQCVP